MPKPRMTRADKWKKRKVVLRYWEFKDKVREAGIELSGEFSVGFNVPMPKSWTKKKRREMFGMPHLQRPDLDNYLKALMDAVFEEDSHVYKVSMCKHWAETGSMEIVNYE